MKKRLLTVAFALLSVATSFAYQTGDYAYSTTQRFKINGDNIVQNGNFADGREGWKSVDQDTEANPEVWDIKEGEGPNGENVLQSLGATADQPLCNSWKLDAGTYVVSFDLKYTAAGYTTVQTGGEATSNGNCDFFLNGDGSFTKVASTDAAPVKNVAAQTNYPADEWKNIVFFFTAEQDQYLVMRFEKLPDGMQITNIEIHPAEEVYDVRKAQNRIAYAKELLANDNFNIDAAQDAKKKLEETYIAGIEAMIEGGELDDPSNAESMMSEFEEALEAYLSASSVNLKSLIPGLDITSQSYYGRGGIGSNAAKWKLDLSGNWGHLNTEPDALRSAIQTGYAHSATYAAYHEDLPAGKYYFSCEIRNANTDRSSWPTNPTFSLETEGTRLYVGSDSLDLPAISGEEYQRFSLVAEVAENGAVRAGVYWPGVSSGGAFFVRNTEMRAFNLNVVADVEHVQAFKSYMTQLNAATNARNGLKDMQGNGNYPWDQQVLADARAKYDPYYYEQLNKKWQDADGNDTGVATTDDLNDWALYQGIEEYTDNEDGTQTRKAYQVVRGYQNAANTVKATNQVITDLAEAIDAAKKTRNQGGNLTGDRDAYKTAILAALETLKTVRSATTDATRVADSTTLAQAKETLAQATEAFLASVKDAPIIDIDFSNGFKEDTGDNAPAPYYIEGAAGRMYFTNVNTEDNKTDDNNFKLGYGEEYLDVLRVGNGKGIVYLNESDYPTEEEVLSISFDYFHGSLSGRYAGVELQNAAGQRVAGFSLNRYNGTLNYNDFNDVLTNGGEGMNILAYATGIGDSKNGNAAIAADKNRTTYTLEINYKDKTLQGTITNPQKGTCEGKPMPFRSDSEITDHVVTQFVVQSGYNSAPARNCWFDNLVIKKFGTIAGDAEEDIPESPWSDVVNAIKTVNTAKAAAAIYSVSGVRVEKATKPGLYIQNGKKFVVK